METKELIKKYWFIGVVGLLLLVFIGMYIADTISNQPVTVKTKQVDGKDIAYSIDDTNVTADELFNTLNESSGAQVAFIALERAVFDKAYETTQELSDAAASNAQAIISYYGESYVADVLKNMGYVNGIDDLTQYYIDSEKQSMLQNEYALAHADEYITPDLGTNGRVIYHILVSVADVTEVTDDDGNVVSYTANPTEEETAALNEVLAALETDTFELVAYNYSDDTGSASSGGYIGAVNEENMDMYDVAFKNEAMRLAEGEVSEPIVSQFGYHIIYNAAMSAENAVEDYYFMYDVSSNHQDMMIKAIMEKADEYGFEIVSEDLKTMIEAQMGGAQ
ncbi:MAG: peptidylprolyl isomerase [Erysipelotrichaceae bacterium]|nr:peptidylprolyl isomerase [Erysipelotrichaceae bacterium]